MKALFIIPEYPPGFGGGIATYYGTLLPALRRHGVEITAVVGSSLADGPCAAELEGVNIMPLDRARAARLRSAFAAFALAPDFACHLAAAWAAWEQTDGGRGYDVVESTDWGLLFVPWLVAERAPATLVRMHGSIGQIGRHDPQSGCVLAETLAGFAEDTLLPHAARLATYGRGNQAAWAHRLRRPVDHVAPPLAPHFVEPAGTESSEAGLVVGRVQAWKGPETLCKALRRLGSDAPRIDWIGRDLPRPGRAGTVGSCLRSAYPGIWGGRIRHQEAVPPKVIRQRQAAARFVVVPSDWDVFNLGAAEAMASGSIVICSEGAGAADLIDDGVNGFRFPAGDDAALAACLQRLASLTAAERERLSASARATVSAELDPDEVAARHVAQFEQTRDTARHPVSPDQRALFSPSSRADLGSAGLARLPVRGLAFHVAQRLVSKFRALP